jgi:hypothetical protein
MMLSKQEELELIEITERKRREHNLGMSPIGDSIFKLVRDLGITILYYPNKKENIKTMFMPYTRW